MAAGFPGILVLLAATILVFCRLFFFRLLLLFYDSHGTARRLFWFENFGEKRIFLFAHGLTSFYIIRLKT